MIGKGTLLLAILAAAGALAAALVLTKAPQSPDPALHTVHIVSQDADPDNPWAFDPALIQIRPGTRVRWINHKSAFHTVTFTDSLDVKEPNGRLDRSLFAAGEMIEYNFAEPGVYHYYCQPHSDFMFGTIIVKS